jgi:hypothetical protein
VLAGLKVWIFLSFRGMWGQLPGVSSSCPQPARNVKRPCGMFPYNKTL